MQQFFPNPLFGWGFITVLAGILLAASVSDLRTTVIPKSLSVTGALLGFLANVIRCGWLASLNKPTWSFSEPTIALALFDGILFSLAGFALGFFLFTGLWILGVCGGGDVKLFAAVGAWIGPLWCLYVLAMTLILLCVIVLLQAVVAVFGGNLKRMQARKPHAEAGKPRRRLLTFALPLTIATLLVLSWKLHTELMPAPALGQAAVQGDTHAT